MKRRVVWGTLTLLCAVLIGTLSWQSAEQSTDLSTAVVKMVITLFGGETAVLPPPASDGAFHELFRNLAHCAEFAALGFCAAGFTHSLPLKKWAVSVPACMVFAVWDECLQHWRGMGRAFELADIARDWLGVLFGTALLCAVYRVYRRKQGGQ